MSSHGSEPPVGGAPGTPPAVPSTADHPAEPLGPPDAVPCAGGIVVDERGRLLLIQRGTPPARGRWSVPGGRVEPGETLEQACVREVAEETGLTVAVVRRAGRVYRDGPGGVVYAIDDFVCTPVSGTLHAATDADDARWVDAAAYHALDDADELAPQLTEALGGWGVLPRA